MTTTEENLRTFLFADANIKAAVKAISYNSVPQNKSTPYIFYQQSGSDDDISLGDQPGDPTRVRFAIEIWDSTPAGAIAFKKLVQRRLHKAHGTFGDSTVQGIFAADLDDQYIASGNGGDEGLHGAFLTAEVVT